MKHTFNLTSKKEFITLTHNKNILKGLNHIFGYDFTSDYKIFSCNGYFTYNSICNSLDIDIQKQKACLVCKRTDDKWNRWHVVNINKTFETEIDTRWTTLNDYYAKYVFEDLRKSGNLIYFVIIQDKDRLKLNKRKATFDKNTRYKVVDSSKMRSHSGTYSYIYRVNVANNNDLLTFYPRNNNDTLRSVIDKSGYIKSLQNLDERLSAFKFNNDIDKLYGLDITSEYKNIYNSLNKLKNDTITAFKSTNEFDELNDLERALRKYKYIVNDYNRALGGSINRYSTMKRLLKSIQDQFAEAYSIIPLQELKGALYETRI